MIAALLLLLQTAGAIPGFTGVQPNGDERLALPHIAEAMRGGDAAARAKSLDAALALLPQPTRFRGAFQCMRGSVLLGTEEAAKKAAGVAAVDECYRLNPDVAVAQRMKAQVLLDAGDVRAGAVLLARSIEREPRLAQGLTREPLDRILRELGYAEAFAERRSLVIALAGTDVARDDLARYSGWVRLAVQERAEKGDLAGAAELLPYIVDPSDGLAMLIDRRFEALWPRIETWAGGDLATQRDALVRAARSAYELTPDLEHARATATVLARNGYGAEAVSLLERAITAFGKPRDDYDYAMAVVRLATLRARGGERNPARILQPLEAAMADGIVGPMLINVVPNLALDQIALGRPVDALATLDRYPTKPDQVEVEAAYGYFVAIRGCALARSGRTKEAKAAFAEVERRYSTNRGATDLAIVCGGDDAAVLKGWLAAVDDPERRGGALLSMTEVRAGVPGDALSMNTPRLLAIKDRHKVSERMARYARLLPASYLPVLRRMGSD